ncbi:putative P2Y purinoceptor 10 [Ahaetulla prasina]|uniref:putative P2Y purinoceptor 10 n=1 Tax=Ahaetulla prasina TaxID=499056 RepID=UPI0026470433|nr:putative P2Y purinoceptor 10 [Ahaetulla prasina]XP_058052932.1 putative P2Y purinoceptor 10 [Ahaetulla prasina]
MPADNSSENCSDPSMGFQASLYAATYVIIFIPGLVGNSLALWVLCCFIKRESKAVVFMMNLAVADLAHVLSLPLRMYYYINHRWPFGSFLCQFCFYLKYLNMYASICFLTCISIQRYLFLLHPFRTKSWNCRHDVAVSAVIWIAVGAACLPLPILRSPSLTNNDNTCFADLGVKQLTRGASITLMAVAELSGFLLPLAIIIYCTWKMRQSLQDPHAPLQQADERRKAWRLILGCAAVFFICFTPYHVNLPIFMMVKQGVFGSCSVRHQVLNFHTISLCLASLNCCLDPILYYFMTSEFQQRLFRHSRAAFLHRFIHLDNSRTAVFAAKEEEEEGGKRSENVLMAYFRPFRPQRLENDSMEPSLSPQ